MERFTRQWTDKIRAKHVYQGMFVTVFFYVLFQFWGDMNAAREGSARTKGFDVTWVAALLTRSTTEFVRGAWIEFQQKPLLFFLDSTLAVFSVACLISAGWCIFAKHNSNRMQHYIFKPLATFTLFLISLYVAGGSDSIQDSVCQIVEFSPVVRVVHQTWGSLHGASACSGATSLAPEGQLLTCPALANNVSLSVISVNTPPAGALMIPQPDPWYEITSVRVYYEEWVSHGHSDRYLVSLGLLFSLLGDIFLMLPQDAFVQGLVSFLVAHLFYIASFSLGTGWVFTGWTFVLLSLYAIVLLRYLYPFLGKMKGPVTVYAFVMLMMAWRAFEKYIQTESVSGLFTMLGSILFVLSDSMLAIDRFVGSRPAFTIFVLSTYFIAQWMISLSIHV